VRFIRSTCPFVDFGEPVFDPMLATSQVEHMRQTSRCGTIHVSRRQPELDAVVGQHRMDFVGNSFDERAEEGRRGEAIGVFD